MAATAWYFAEKPDGSLVRIPTARFFRFHDGADSLAPTRGGEVHIAGVYLVVDRRVVVRLMGANFSRYRLAPDGTIDPEHRADGLRGAMLASGFGSVPRADGVEDLDRRIRRRDYDRDHGWKPTPEQIHELARRINAAAADPPVVIVTAEGLQRV